MKRMERKNSGLSRREFLWKAGASVAVVSGTGLSSGIAASQDQQNAKSIDDLHTPLPSSSLTFDAVQSSGHEVSYEELAGYFAGPMSKHPVVSVKAHPEVIWGRPDLGIGMVANPITFAVGAEPRQVHWPDVRKSLHSGYLPVITARWQDGPLCYEQLSFAYLPFNREVKTGHEKQVVMVQMSMTNTEFSESQRAVLWTFVPYAVAAKALPPPPYDTYNLFEVTGSLPAIPQTPVARTDDVIRHGSILLGVHSEDQGVLVTGFEGAIKYEMNLRPGETKSIRLVVSSNAKGLSAEQIDSLRKVDFFSARDQRILDLETLLLQGTQIQVPEGIVNNIYKSQILYNQPQMVQAADRDYYMPVQGYMGVWPWETMKMLVPLDATGYHQDVAKSLGYFPKTQDMFRPRGDISGDPGFFGGTAAFEESDWVDDSASSLYGVFATKNKGKWVPGWMNFTGSILYTFGEHYFLSDDAACLRRYAPSLIKACDWVIAQRQRTKKKDSQGQKVPHYGLMPAGEPYDVSQKEAKSPAYYFCFTDGYTSAGFTRIAQALDSIGHPEGKRLLHEAEDYRQDVLAVMKRTRETQPELPPYPDHLGLPPYPGWADFAAGALSLVDTGFLDPRDPAFLQLENYMKKRYNRGVLGLTGGLRENDPQIPNSFYVDMSEDIWQRAWMLRGDVEKSLLAFYSMLAFGVDKETLGSVERFDLYDRRYAPFCMDASGSSRLIGLIRQTLLFEESRELYLLAGAPRRWFENGKVIEVKKAVTYFGSFDMTTKSEIDEELIRIDLALEIRHPERLREVHLRVAHPQRKRIRKVTINGVRWGKIDPSREMISLPPEKTPQKILVHFA